MLKNQLNGFRKKKLKNRFSYKHLQRKNIFIKNILNRHIVKPTLNFLKMMIFLLDIYIIITL